VRACVYVHACVCASMAPLHHNLPSGSVCNAQGWCFTPVRSTAQHRPGSANETATAAALSESEQPLRFFELVHARAWAFWSCSACVQQLPKTSRAAILEYHWMNQLTHVLRHAPNQCCMQAAIQPCTTQRDICGKNKQHHPATSCAEGHPCLGCTSLPQGLPPRPASRLAEVS